MKWTAFRELVNTCILTLHVILLHNRGRASVSASFEINQLAPWSRDRMNTLVHVQRSTFLSFINSSLKKMCQKNVHFSIFVFSLPQILLFLLSSFIYRYIQINFTSKVPRVIQNILHPKLSRFKRSILVWHIDISLTFTDVPYIYIEIPIHGPQNMCKTPLPSFHLLLNTRCDKMVLLWKKKEEETRDFNTPFDPPIRIIKATRSQHIWGE